MEKESLTTAKIRATAIAHAINLGYCPPVGTIVGFSAQVKSLDTATFATKNETEKKQYSFTVTEQDIASARELIASKQASYIPKVTVVPLR